MVTIALYKGPTRGYSLTDTDVLWLARAFVGEAGEDITREEACYHFYCWLDRFLLVRGRWLTEGKSFAALLQAHSQPINPIWASPYTDKCQALDPGQTDECSPARIARRKYVTNLSASQLKSFGVYQLALEAQNGTLERMESQPLYDFAACSLVAKQGRPCTGITVKNQCFLTYDCLKSDEKKAVIKNADGSLAEVEGGITTKRLGITALGILFGVVVTWAVWTLYKKRKR